MPEELETEEVELEEAEELEEEPTAEVSDDGSGGEPDKATEEYFLTINDRTRYRTQEDAVKAFDNAGQRLASYSRYGSPEQVAELAQKAQLVEQLFGSGKISNDPKDPLADLNPTQRAEWDRYWKRFQAVAENAGYVKADKIDEIVEQRVSRYSQEQQARSTIEADLRARGIELSPARYRAVEAAIVEAANADEELNQLWHAGQIAEFSRKALEFVYGPAPKPAADKDTQERGPDGKFVKRSEYAETKDKTKKLPKAAPKGSGASADGAQEPSVEDRIDPVKRKKRALELLTERLG